MSQKSIIDMHNTITAERLEMLIRFQLAQLFANPESADELPPIMIWGAPGIGKSTIIREIAKNMGIGFIDVRLAQREPVDIRGLPVPDKDSVKWLVSADWPRDPDSKGIIIFDELTAADRSLQVAAYEFILDRRLGGLYQVPKGWYICAAGNRIEDSAVAMTMSSALANRFLHVELAANAQDWVKWAASHNIHPSVVDFIKSKPGLLFKQEMENLERGWPTPRSWARVSAMLQAFEDEYGKLSAADKDHETNMLINASIYGLVGKRAGAEFAAFRKDSDDCGKTVTSETLEKLIRLQLTQLFKHPEHADDLPPIMIWGAPGIGKSTIVREIAKDMGIGFIDVRLAQREPVDIRGLPVPDKDSVKWLVSADWPRDSDSKGIIIFDELTAADRSLQVAAYEFILDRRLGGLYQVPKGWYICAAGNRIEDSAVAMPMSSALANRFLHVELAANAQDWVKWAISHNIHPAVIGFIQFRPGLLFEQDKENLERGWPTPRSWARVSAMLQAFENGNGGPSAVVDQDIEMLINASIYGLVGNQAGAEFAAFRKISKKFDNVYDIMSTRNSKFTIPEKPDEKYAFCAAVVYHLWRAKDEEMEKLYIANYYRIAMELSSDYATMMMMNALVGNGKQISRECSRKLYKHPGFSEWSRRHGQLMSTTMNKKGA